MEEKNYNNTAKSHKVLLVNRGNGAFSGVVDVLSLMWRRFCSRRNWGCCSSRDRICT